MFARQVEALCKAGDLLIIHSTSGNSPNLLRAADAAKKKGCQARVQRARRRRAQAIADHSMVVPTQRTDRAQEIQLSIEHAICELIESAL